jgi:hypothetical protein
MKKVTIGLCSLLPMFLSACADIGPDIEAQEDPNAEAESAEPLRLGASFKTQSGGKVDIYQDSDDGIIISIVEPAMSNETIASYQRGKSDFVDLYTGLTGQRDVPEDVVKMNRIFLKQRAQANAAATPQTEDTANLADAPSRKVLSLERKDVLENEFVAQYCNCPGCSYTYCWPNQKGMRIHTGWHYSSTSYAYAVNGTITHRIDRKKFLGKWKTLFENTVPAGYLSYLDRTADGFQDNMRTGVWNADGDTYHLAIYGIL